MQGVFMNNFRSMFFVAVATVVVSGSVHAGQKAVFSQQRIERVQKLNKNGAAIAGGTAAVGILLNKTTHKTHAIGEGLQEAGVSGMIQVIAGGSTQAVVSTMVVDGVLQGGEALLGDNKTAQAAMDCVPLAKTSYGRYMWRVLVSNLCGLGFDVKSAKANS